MKVVLMLRLEALVSDDLLMFTVSYFLGKAFGDVIVTHMIDPNASLQDIARAAGVSSMTASRVLRQLPGASSATRDRVLAVAKELGYAPDPDITRAMSLVRSRKEKRDRATLAIVREEPSEDELRNGCCHFVPTTDFSFSAAAYGYRVEEFWLGRNGITPQRLSDVLHARGIEGVIVSPQSVAMPCQHLDYSRFAAVTVGYALQTPSLHRSITNVVPGMRFAFDQLEARGYRRIGIAIGEWLDMRTQHIYSSSLLRYQHGLSPTRCVPLLTFPHNDVSQNEKMFCRWVQDHGPDVIISYEHFIPQWLKKLGMRIPQDVGLVVHDWIPGMTQFAAINHRRDHIAACAVDLLAVQLMRGERGIPDVPRQIAIPPAWVEGPSIRVG